MKSDIFKRLRYLIISRITEAALLQPFCSIKKITFTALIKRGFIPSGESCTVFSLQSKYLPTHLYRRVSAFINWTENCNPSILVCHPSNEHKNHQNKSERIWRRLNEPLFSLVYRWIKALKLCPLTVLQPASPSSDFHWKKFVKFDKNLEHSINDITINYNFIIDCISICKEEQHPILNIKFILISTVYLLT